MKQWFRIKVQADDPQVADINVFDFIGDWVDDLWGFDGVTTAKSFIAELEKIPATVKVLRVHINSPGGDVFGAVTIANALRDQRATKGRKVETIVDGLAASAASIIAMAGAPVRMSDNALLMIHNPWSITVGDADDMLKAVESLGKVRSTLVDTYQWHSELDDDEIEALMDAETWMDAEEAIEYGFADEVIEGLRAAASIDPRGLAKIRVPEHYAERVAAFVRQPDFDIVVRVKPAPAKTEPEILAATAGEILELCAEAKLGIHFARKLTAGGVTLADAMQLIAAERERLDAEDGRQTAIRALCKKYDLEVLGSALISGGVPLEDAKTIVAEVTAKVDVAEIDAGLSPDNGARHKPAINYDEAHARINNPLAFSRQ